MSLKPSSSFLSGSSGISTSVTPSGSSGFLWRQHKLRCYRSNKLSPRLPAMQGSDVSAQRSLLHVPFTPTIAPSPNVSAMVDWLHQVLMRALHRQHQLPSTPPLTPRWKSQTGQYPFHIHISPIHRKYYRASYLYSHEDHA